MFAITTKARLAAGIAAGALTLGAAGAYAAQNLPVTITHPTISTLGAPGTPQLNLVSLNLAPQLHNPTSPIRNAGECVSFFATNRNYALVPQGYKAGDPITISKPNYHGKLMSGLNAWCKAQIAAGLGTGSTTLTTSSGTTGSSGSTTDGSASGSSNGHGLAKGHGKHGQ